jgi:FKBP-type peptidyl-prolyl cis-trans isomerase
MNEGGGERELITPSQLGYGEEGALPDIPSNIGLNFEIQLLGVKN